ncbi:phosphotriesterase [Streptomyces sp. NPDC050560]|uniref:phosphotriesterase n=1 Tax=Streptomyces sp. NPDC050560 TaxID=3365630 RepID=UPI00378C578B
MVRTVLGDIAPGDLGPVDYHEHLFQASPLLPGDELDDEGASTAEAAALRRSGACAMVEATPAGLGERPAAVARAAAAAGLHIVHTTGAHRAEHYAAGHPLFGEDSGRLRARFRRDLLSGMADGGAAARAPGGAPVRAGLLKAGAGYWSLGGHERRVLEAVGTLAGETGAPVMVHLEHGSAAHEVLDLLAGHGCPAERVALAHVDRNPDPGLHLELAARGALLGYDGAARHRRAPDSVLVECLTRVVEGGGGRALLLGGDVARRSRYAAYGGMPGLRYLFDRFVPRVRAAVGEAATRQILVTNAARWLAWHPPES